MRPSWYFIIGPHRDRHDSPQAFAIAKDDADAGLRQMLLDVFCPRQTRPMSPQPLAYCTDPVPECIALRFALPTGLGTLCTRWPATIAQIPPGATAVIYDDDTATCNRFHVRTPKRRTTPRCPRPKSGSRAPHVAEGHKIRRWLLTAVSQAAAQDGDLARQARTLLAGDLPDDDAALIAWLRTRRRDEHADR